MATLRIDKRSGFWQIRFYWGGEQQQRSCGTKRRSDAYRTLAAAEDTIQLLKTGRLEMPSDVDPFDWILSGGKLPSKPASNGKTQDKRFGKICDAYYEDQKQKQDTTLYGETVHIRHLKRLLSSSTPIQNIDLDALRSYRRRRAKQRHRGKPISDATIKKELVTFRQVWIWAKRNGYVKATCPLLDDNGRWKLQFEKPDAQAKFQTWHQIERKIQRGGLDNDEIAELWEGLFLDNSQVTELLIHVNSHAMHPFVYPIFAFAA